MLKVTQLHNNKTAGPLCLDVVSLLIPLSKIHFIEISKNQDVSTQCQRHFHDGFGHFHYSFMVVGVYSKRQ